MDRTLLPVLAATALAAGLVAAGASYVVVSTLTSAAPPAMAPPAGPPPPGPPPPGPTPPPGEEDAIWAFSIRGQLPEAPGGRGTVVVFLGKVQGDANVSAANGSIPVEVAAVSWDARAVQPIGNGTILEAMNLMFARAPPLALTRAALSRDQDAVELTVPPANVSTVVVNAPATAGFLAIAWPTGTPYAWNEETGQWANVREATMLARPLAEG